MITFDQAEKAQFKLAYDLIDHYSKNGRNLLGIDVEVEPTEGYILVVRWAKDALTTVNIPNRIDGVLVRFVRRSSIPPR